jgi:hypothetical protein
VASTPVNAPAYLHRESSHRQSYRDLHLAA